MSVRRYHQYMPIWLLVGISAAGAPTIAQAEVHVEGTMAAVHVTTDKDGIPDVLSAFGAPFNLRYYTSVPLDGNVSSEYSGSLAHVISRLLGGYDYVIAHDQGTIEIVVSGKRKTAAELQIAREQQATDRRMERAKRASDIQAVMQQKRGGQ
jgi:hypothetical protein